MGFTQLGSTLANMSSPSISDSRSSIRVRCEPDPLDPEGNLCFAKVTTDDRQGISHFFGRNKRATASIPDDMFPLLCRTHYQEKQYRWKENPTAFAAFQCDCILTTLARMATKTFVDAEGERWPWWCGFELQLQSSAQLIGDGAPAQDNAIHAPTGKQARKQATSGGVPDWLRSLCSRTEDTETSRSYTTVGDRGGMRYDFQQLATIVKAIKTWCLQNDARVPAVEALPITIGMADEMEVEAAKQRLKEAKRVRHMADLEMQKLERQHSNPRNHKLQSKLNSAKKNADVAEAAVLASQEALEMAAHDAEATQATVPAKRRPRKVSIGKEQPIPEATQRGNGDSELTPDVSDGKVVDRILETSARRSTIRQATAFAKTKRRLSNADDSEQSRRVKLKSA